MNVADLAYTLEQRGWRRPAAAGIAGNVAGESGVSLNPRAIGDGGQAIGLFQHNGPRAQALQAYASQRGKSWDDPLVQVDFAEHEINTQYPGLRERLNASATPHHAATTFMNEFERPAERQRNAAVRGAFARQIASVLDRLAPVGVAQAASPKPQRSLDDAVNSFLSEAEPTAAAKLPSSGNSLDAAVEAFLSEQEPEQPAPAPPPGAAAPQTDEVKAVGQVLDATLGKGATVGDVVGKAAGAAADYAINAPAQDLIASRAQEAGQQALSAVPSMADLSRGAGQLNNELSGAAQGVVPSQDQPLGVVAQDDAGRVIIDPGQGQQWTQFDPKQHYVLRGPDGQPTAYARTPQNEEGPLGRLGRLLRLGVGGRMPAVSAERAPPVAAAAESAPAAHWSAAQKRDALGRFTK